MAISNCSHDENGRYAGGQAGDQGGEWTVRDWYSRPWDVVLRCTDPNVRQLLARLSRDAAENDKIGYDQGTAGNSDDRYSFWNQLKASGYYPKNIKIACETDCSASTLALIKAVGYLLDIKALQDVSIYGYTGNLEKILKRTGLFKALKEEKYLTSPDYILAGDVLLCDGHHVCINLDDGPRTDKETWYESRITVGKNGLTVLATGLNLRMGPGVAYKLLSSVKAGTQLRPTGKAYYQGKLWFHCSAGWFSGSYVEGWIQEENGRWWYITEGAKYPTATVKQIDGKWYAFDKDGWNVTADRIDPNGCIE